MSKERILIVDDEASMCEFLTLVLSKEGYRVRAVMSASQALAVLEEEPFQLMVTDLRMPDMNGLELIRETRRRFPELGVVVITAFASLESAVEALRLGASDYITKPFQVDEILTDGQSLPVLGGLRVVETPGHTPGHISLFAPQVGILFCGDSMVTYDNNIDNDPRPAATWDQARAKESNIKQSMLGVRIVCSGHGPVVMDAAGKFPV